jgi:hypothetical protein
MMSIAKFVELEPLERRSVTYVLEPVWIGLMMQLESNIVLLSKFIKMVSILETKFKRLIQMN